jgi:hypothetical protein
MGIIFLESFKFGESYLSVVPGRDFEILCDSYYCVVPGREFEISRDSYY